MRAAVLAFALAGCGSPADHPPDGAAPDASCTPGPLPLHVMPLAVPSGTTYPGKLYVEVVRAGEHGLFLLDTGSAQTFLREPLGAPPQANAGTVELGCESLALPGFAEADLGSFDGLTVIGTHGLDRLLGAPSLIDIDHARLAIGGPFPETTDWPAAPFDLVQTTLLAHATLEGHDVRLLVDTGATHTLWLGQPAQPGDTPITTVDSAGYPLTIYLGTGDLAIGGVHRTVPLVRAPSFPYLEEYVQMLGGNIAGLVGLSTFAHGLAIDPAGHTIRVR